jgi:putative MATE family efflux protein
MIWGIAAIMSLNIVDTWFVAQLSESHLAAISFTFPVTMILISLGIGLMAGTASVLSRVIGQGDMHLVRRMTTDATTLATALSIVVTVIGLVSMEPLFRAMGADDTLLPLIMDYMSVWYLGFVFFLVPMVGFGAIRATGDSKLQRNIMVGVALLNLILDPLLIFGLAGLPRLEMEGAALASVISRSMSLFAGYWALHQKKRLLTFTLPTAAEFWQSNRGVLHVGLPAAGTNMIIPLAAAIIVAMVATFGSDAVAGYGAATRIEQITLVVFYAMSSMIGPFVGQNLGAGKFDRIELAMSLCWRFCLWCGGGLAVVLILIGPVLVGFFGAGEAVNQVGRAYLWIVPLSFGLNGAVMVINAAFNGLGKPMPAVAISLTRMFVLTVPLAYCGSLVWGVEGIFAGVAIANSLSGILAWVWFKRVLKQFQATEENYERR